MSLFVHFFLDGFPKYLNLFTLKYFQAKRDEEEARLAEVEGLVDLLQKEPGPFKSPPLSPDDGKKSQLFCNRDKSCN